MENVLIQKMGEEMKTTVLLLAMTAICIIISGVFMVSSALAPLNRIYGDKLNIEWKTLTIKNIFYEPIVICGTLVDPNYLSHKVKREFVAWGDENERWVHIEGDNAVFYKIQNTMCK